MPNIDSTSRITLVTENIDNWETYKATVHQDLSRLQFRQLGCVSKVPEDASLPLKEEKKKMPHPPQQSDRGLVLAVQNDKHLTTVKNRR